MKILIIEDQENLANLIKDGLNAEGFTADIVFDGEAGLSRIEFHHASYDLIILDIMLPKKDGFEVCRETRADNIMTPILILTSKDSPDDVIKGLNAGADDYLIKPFSFEVLLARIKAILRRPKETLPPELKIRDIRLNPTTREVVKDGKKIALTLKEFSLLEYLMRHKNQAVNREQIISNLWDFAFDSFSNIVDVHVTNLRKKLGDTKATVIETVRGIGYRLNE
ncbi:MAG: response regulator transcription factor [Patescibacteria group bacterium]|jgi:DNA-binding response OmpR family regulator